MTQFKTTEVPQKNRKKKVLGAGLALAITAGAIGGTYAAWTDAETAGVDIGTGGFNIEISTDGGETWLDNTTTEGAAAISIGSITDDVGGNAFRPGDELTETILIRSDAPTTHDGVILEENIEEELSGFFAEGADYFNYSLTNEDGEDGYVVVPASDDGAGEPVAFEFTVGFDDVVDVPQGASGSAEFIFNADLYDDSVDYTG